MMRTRITTLFGIALLLFAVSCEKQMPTEAPPTDPTKVWLSAQGGSRGLGKKGDCTAIQDGTLLRSDEVPIVLGYDEWGYNYQANIFNGGYCDAYRNADWCHPYKDVNLIMKWNDPWLSNKDCDDDGKLDRHYGFDSYIGSGAWLTNHQSGGKGKDHWTGLRAPYHFL